MSWMWLVVVFALLLGLFGGWAARRDENAAYIEARARWMAQQMLTARAGRRVPCPALPEPTDVIDAEVVYAHATRPDRPEVEA